MPLIRAAAPSTEALTNNIATIGENQSLRRAAVLEVSQGVVVSYVHNAAAPNMGKIGVLVALESAAPADALTALGKQLAMHIAAANPLALDADGLDAELLARERAIAVEKAAESGKPANIVEKMVDGTMAKFAKENALLSQLFVIDGKTPIADVVAAAGKEAGSPITLKASSASSSARALSARRATSPPKSPPPRASPSRSPNQRRHVGSGAGAS